MESLIETIGQIPIDKLMIYLVCANIIGFLSMFIDKKKAEKGAWRISEHTLLMIAFLGGSIGSIIGMYKFRHKTQKPRFYIGVPVIITLQIVFVIYVITHV
jgi:uncharacterized membrane protein YsdA (DUF1294 family)